MYDAAVSPRFGALAILAVVRMNSIVVVNRHETRQANLSAQRLKFVKIELFWCDWQGICYTATFRVRAANGAIEVPRARRCVSLFV